MRSLLTMALTGLLVAALAASAQAASWDLSGYGGYARSFQDDGTNGSYGMRASVFAMVTPSIGIGGEVGRNRLGDTDPFDVLQPGTMIQTSGTASVSGWVLTGSAKWRPRLGSWRPFIVGGAGFYPLTYTFKLETGFREDVDRKQFGYNLGAGLAWVPRDSQVAIGLDVRWNSVPEGRLTPEQLQEEIDTGMMVDGSVLNYGTIFLGVTYNTANSP